MTACWLWGFKHNIEHKNYVTLDLIHSFLLDMENCNKHSYNYCLLAKSIYNHVSDNKACSTIQQLLLNDDYQVEVFIIDKTGTMNGWEQDLKLLL